MIGAIICIVVGGKVVVGCCGIVDGAGVVVVVSGRWPLMVRANPRCTSTVSDRKRRAIPAPIEL